MHNIGGNADGVVNAEELAELIKNREGETCIGTQSDGHSGKLTQQTTQDAQEQRHDASMTGGGATAQTGCQQTAGMPLEDQQRVYGRTRGCPLQHPFLEKKALWR